MRVSVPIGKVRARAFTIPTDKPEADGTIAWNSTTLIVVEVFGGNVVGLAYTYASASITALIESKLAETIVGLDAMDPQAAWRAMQRAVRNLGREGLAASAISAVDAALYDLKARILDVPLAPMLGTYRDAIPIYGSGGFTTYSDDELKSQLGCWVSRNGCAFVKMKVGTDPDDDPRRVAVAKAAIGDATLFVDANGAYTVKQALALAARFADQKVGWFEEPVSSDDLRGLRADPQSRARWNGHRSRRIRLYDLLCPRDARGGSGRRAASRRHALRRRDGVSADWRIVRGVPNRSVRSLCAGAASARCLRSSAIAPSRMVS